MVMMKLISMTDDVLLLTLVVPQDAVTVLQDGDDEGDFNHDMLLLTLIVPQDAVPNDYTNVAVAACDDGM